MTFKCTTVYVGYSSSVVSIGNESAPIQLAQCLLPGLAIFNAKILIYFSNKIYESNFMKQLALGNCMLWFEITKTLIAI